MAGDQDLLVSEVFGPTIQGEGPSLGMRAGFVRLGRCNLACSFCDTAYTWDWTRFDPAVELTHQTAQDIAVAIQAMAVTLVVITGGEPLLQQSRLPELFAALKAGGHRIEVETAGTLAPTTEVADLVDQFNVSPKLANSGNAFDQRYKPTVLRAFEAGGKAAFKFVAVAPFDLDEIQSIVDECGLSDVWVMPEGRDSATVLARGRDLADAVTARGWNLTTRLHTLLWGDQRGV